MNALRHSSVSVSATVIPPLHVTWSQIDSALLTMGPYMNGGVPFRDGESHCGEVESRSIHLARPMLLL